MAHLIIVEDNLELGALIASTARFRGHTARVETTGLGARAALESESFALAIVDLLLPDVSGTEVLAATQSRGVPAIAISGVYKGDRFAQVSKEQYGAKAFFEKPFSMTELLAEVERLVGVPKAVEANDPEAPLASPEELQLPLVVEDPLATDDWERPWLRTAKAPPRPAPAFPEWARAGDLSATSVPRLLNAYFTAKHSGELILRQGQITKVVYFESGLPVYAASNLAHERFARFCARKGLITTQDLEAVAQLAREQGWRTGDAMVRLELITSDQRKALLEEQVKEIIWSAFPWTGGEFRFTPKTLNRPDLVKLRVFTGTLVLEGIMKTLSLVQLRAKISGSRRLIPTADPPYELSEFSLSGAQARLIANSDGTKTVDDVLTISELPEKEALATLHAFELLGVLEERSESPRRNRVAFAL